MSRAVWFVAGASAGVYAMNKARRFAGSLSAEGFRTRWQGVQHGLRLVAQDAKQAQVEREDQLRQQMGLPSVHVRADRQLTAGSTPSTPAPVLAPPVENDQKDSH